MDVNVTVSSMYYDVLVFLFKENYNIQSKVIKKNCKLEIKIVVIKRIYHNRCKQFGFLDFSLPSMVRNISAAGFIFGDYYNLQYILVTQENSF